MRVPAPGLDGRSQLRQTLEAGSRQASLSTVELGSEEVEKAARARDMDIWSGDSWAEVSVLPLSGARAHVANDTRKPRSLRRNYLASNRTTTTGCSSVRASIRINIGAMSRVARRHMHPDVASCMWLS